MKLFCKIFLILTLATHISFALEVAAEQALLMDFETGEVLFNKNGDEKVFPSSMTKIMTAYLVFEKLNSGNMKLTDQIKISGDAWRQVGSRMFLNVGAKVAVDDLLMGLAVQSGNDAAYSLAEGSSGSIGDFVKEMNEKAVQLGLKNTSFTNPIGFSDEGHYMSVKDTAILSQQMISHFPQYYIKYFPVVEYKYNNILQANRNLLLKTYEGTDGIKTGHTEAGGYALAASAFRDGRRLIAVVNGSAGERERAEETTKLLDYGFNTLVRHRIYGKNETVEKASVRYGTAKTVDVMAKDDIYGTVENRDDIKVEINIKNKLKAPIYRDEKVGTLTIKTPIDERQYNLYAKKSVSEVNIFKKIFLAIYYFFWDLFG